MSRERVFGTLCAMVLLVNLSRIVFAPLLEELITVFSLSNSTAGLVVTMVWIGSALLRIPVGWIMTWIPRHHVVLGIGVLLSGASLFTALSSHIASVVGLSPVILLGFGALLIGATSGGYFVAANPFISELYPERVGRAMGMHGTAAQLAAVSAAPFVLLVLSLLTLPWQGVFFIISFGTLVVTGVLFYSAKHSELPETSETGRTFTSAVRAEWQLIALGVCILGFTGFVWQGMFNFYELYMESKGLPSAMAKNMLTIVFSAGVPAFFVSGRLIDRFPSIPYILGILTSFVAVLLLLTVTTGLVPLLLVTALLGYVIHSLFPALDTYLLSSLSGENRASAYAVYSGTMMLLQATGSSAVGFLTDAGFTYNTVFTSFALGLSVVIAGLVVLRQTNRLPG